MAVSFGLFTFSLIAPAPQAMADNMVSQPYDWVLELETKALDRQFQYQGSTLKKIEKVQVTYYPAKDQENKSKYEFLWFNQGKAIGLEKQKKLDIPQGEGVCLKVKHSSDSPTPEEKKAAANAILRLAVDTFINKNPVVQVRLPNSSYGEIVSELNNRGMQEAPNSADDFNNGFSSNLTLYIYSESEAMKTVLYR